MTRTFIAIATAALVTLAHNAAAQEVRGFAFGGSTSDLNKQQYPAFGGGVLIDLGQPWLAGGAQGETFFQWPYVTGRGTVFAEGRILPGAPIRPFVIGGYAFGQDAGPMVGAGIEMRATRSRVGFRLSVEDYVDRTPVSRFAAPDSIQQHRIATRFGITF